MDGSAAVLSCAMLCCAVLSCIVLRRAVLRCAAVQGVVYGVRTEETMAHKDLINRYDYDGGFTVHFTCSQLEALRNLFKFRFNAYYCFTQTFLDHGARTSLSSAPMTVGLLFI